MSLNWGRFQPTLKTEEQKQKEAELQKNNHKAMKNYAKRNGFREVKNDYYGTEIFFYCDKTKTLYTSCPLQIPFEFKVCNDKHILELNKIAT
jgi:predicted RNA-binding protein with PUA-like domain